MRFTSSTTVALSSCFQTADKRNSGKPRARRWLATPLGNREMVWMHSAAVANVERSEKLIAAMKRIQLALAIAYAYDCVVLVGFYFAGFVGLEIPVIVFAALGSMVGAVHLAHVTGWSIKRKDPTLFIAQNFFAISVALGTAIAAPQIAVQPLSSFFAVSAFSYMAPNTKSLVVCWATAAIGAILMVLTKGPLLSMPTSSVLGQLLTCACLMGLLARCMWVVSSFRSLQRRLSEKNKALLAAMDRIESLANHDDLTGLPNRRSITNWLGEQIAICGRTRAPLSVAILDIDHFKRINDTYGHEIGDRALQQFAMEAIKITGETDRMGRYGGEEFLIVLVGTALNKVGEPLERIRARIASANWAIVHRGLQLTLTIGAAEYTRGEPVESLLRRADMALYLGKEAGRNRVVLDSARADSVPLGDAEIDYDLGVSWAGPMPLFGFDSSGEASVCSPLGEPEIELEGAWCDDLYSTISISGVASHWRGKES
jgi:diguanylate cyclase